MLSDYPHRAPILVATARDLIFEGRGAVGPISRAGVGQPSRVLPGPGGSGGIAEPSPSVARVRYGSARHGNSIFYLYINGLLLI